MAALLRKGADFSKVIQATVVAGLHVGILVLSRDLGSAVIFFAAYLVMIYVASRNVGYLALGLAGGSAGAVVAYHLFGHVRPVTVCHWNRRMVWNGIVSGFA